MSRPSSGELPAVAQLSNAVRTSMIVEAVLGIVFGVILLFWPGPTLFVLGVFFGAALVVAGLYRIMYALSGPAGDSTSRLLLGLLGGLIFLAGVVTMISPGNTLVVIAIFIGIGWVFSGVQELLGGGRGFTPAPRWVSVANGVISIVAGLIVFALPGLAVSTFALIAGIMLIVVSIAVLAHLPQRVATN